MPEAKKPKKPSWNHPDWLELHEIGKKIEEEHGHLTQVRRDSPEWQSWRSWFHARDFSTRWSDSLFGDQLMTVTVPFAPTASELASLKAKWISKRKLDL